MLAHLKIKSHFKAEWLSSCYFIYAGRRQLGLRRWEGKCQQLAGAAASTWPQDRLTLLATRPTPALLLPSGRCQSFDGINVPRPFFFTISHYCHWARSLCPVLCRGVVIVSYNRPVFSIEPLQSTSWLYNLSTVVIQHFQRGSGTLHHINPNDNDKDHLVGWIGHQHDHHCPHRNPFSRGVMERI